jgi:ribosomal protein S18 acetylase RimI-like enzyme
MSDNFNRMIELVNSFFDTRNDPDQISVTPADRVRLESIHPATMSEFVDGDGPVAWIMLIPTTHAIRDQFINGVITEQQLLDKTQSGGKYDTIYLCSASVLPEYRHQGLAKKITIDAINNIRKDHPIKSLFYWPFSNDGKTLALAVAKTVGLPLFEKS